MGGVWTLLGVFVGVIWLLIRLCRKSTKIPSHLPCRLLVPPSLPALVPVGRPPRPALLLMICYSASVWLTYLCSKTFPNGN